jgi:hypothetical protein
VSTGDAALPVLLMQPACYTARISLIRQKGVRSDEQKNMKRKRRPQSKNKVQKTRKQERRSMKEETEYHEEPSQKTRDTFFLE